MSTTATWDRYRELLCYCPALDLKLDVSRMLFEDADLAQLEAPLQQALAAMAALEQGAIANPDEHRRVGHYWLRAPQLAPEPELTNEIRNTVEQIKRFASDIHAGTIANARQDSFYVALVVGIGGSALGPQFVADALGGPDDPMLLRFVDNTDPNGIDRVLGELEDELAETLTIVVSKSGSTPETRNGMLEVRAAYERAGLKFAPHAVAVTSAGSQLDQLAQEENWLATFPMWDWVGGRTSELSAVGLLPAALQGFDVDALLAGAAACDEATRASDYRRNPAALLAAMWHVAGNGRGDRAMVVLPYADRLLLLSRYLQQLVMESLGKRVDRQDRVVEQGIAVYGNKGSTDQHAFIQQLREGRNDFFATFIEVLEHRREPSIEVEPGVTAGDYLHGLYQGTRAALFEAGRPSMTITVPRVDAFQVGALIALFERAVGLYAELIDINAYHQPGVEAGKKAAKGVLELQRKVLSHLRDHPDVALTAWEIAGAIDEADAAETIHLLLEHCAAQPDHDLTRTCEGMPFEARYSAGNA